MKSAERLFAVVGMFGFMTAAPALHAQVESQWFEIDFPDDTQMVSASVGWTFR